MAQTITAETPEMMLELTETPNIRGNLQKPPLASHYDAQRLRGVDAGVPRAPLRDMTEDEKTDLRKRLESLGVL